MMARKRAAVRKKPEKLKIKKSPLKSLCKLSFLASLPLLPRLAARAAEAEGRRKGYRVEQFKLMARDGTRLSAALYVPQGDGPFPALVMVHSWMFSRWQCHLYAPWFASDGYVVLAYDCRGWGSSRGEVSCADPDKELRDLEDALDWLLEKSGLPIKEGALGLTGISYGGGHSFLAASRDSRLRTSVPMAGWTDLERGLTPFGSVKWFWDLLLIVSASWATKLDPYNKLYEWLLILLFRRERYPEYSRDMRLRSCLHLAGETRTPMLIFASWNDDLFEPNQIMEFYERLEAPKMLYITNNIHSLDQLPGPRLWGREIWELTKRWFDYWLKDEDNGVLSEPPVRYYAAWRKEMVAEPAWPPPDVEIHRLFLGRAGGEMKMTSRPRGERGEALLKPSLLCPATSGPPALRPQAAGLPVPGPKAAEGRGYFSFTTSPSKQDYELLGIPRLDLKIVPRAQRAQVNALLYDLPPSDGSPTLITYGTMTLDGLVVGEEKTVSFELVAADYFLPQGHRFRLSLCGANAALALPVPGEGVKVIHGDGDSVLRLPLRRMGRA